MSCDEYFSFSNLYGSSYETEIGWSTLCVSNQAKAGILLGLLVLNSVLTLVSGGLFFNGVRLGLTSTPKCLSDGNAFVASLGKLQISQVNCGGLKWAPLVLNRLGSVESVA